MIQLEVKLLKDVSLDHGYHFLGENIAANLRSLLIRQHNIFVVLDGDDEADDHDELVDLPLHKLVLLNVPITVNDGRHDSLILEVVVFLKLNKMK